MSEQREVPKLTKRQWELLAALRPRSAYISAFVFMPGWGIFAHPYANGQSVNARTVESLIVRRLIAYRRRAYRITDAGRKALEGK